MNKKGISGKAIGIIILVIVLLALGWAFLSNNEQTVDNQDSGESVEGSDLGNAIDDTNQIDSDLGLEEDFDYGVE